MAMKKWRLPEQVTRLNPDDLQVPQLKVMLEYLGLALHNQTGGKPGRVEALRKLIAENPQKAQVAYDVVVHNKMPEAAQKVVEDAEAMKSHFYGVMTKMLASEQADKLRTSVEEHVLSLAKRLESDLAAAGRKALAEAAKNYRPVTIKQGGKTTKVKGVLPKEFELIVQLCSQRIPTMLVGPAGCGKTYIAAKAAEALGLNFYDQSCSEGVSESIFTGWLLPVTAGGAFDYVASPFVTAYEKGGLFLLDEIDAADPNLLTFLNKAIANDSFFLPQRHKKPLVKKHPDFVVIAAANTFGKGADTEYVGRNALDAATLDRFRAGMIHMDYSAEVEGALVDPEVLEWGTIIRKCIYAHGLRRIMSTRVMLDMTRMKQNCGWGMDQWERAFLADWSKEELKKLADSRRVPAATGAAA